MTYCLDEDEGLVRFELILVRSFYREYRVVNILFDLIGVLFYRGEKLREVMVMFVDEDDSMEEVEGMCILRKGLVNKVIIRLYFFNSCYVIYCIGYVLLVI